MTFGDDTRGVSIPVMHTMTLAMTALLMLALLSGTGNFLNQQQDTAAADQLQDIGGDVVESLNTLDDLNRTGTVVHASMNVSYPDTVGGQDYTVHLLPESGTVDNDATLYLNASGLSFSVTQSVHTDTPLRESRARGESPGLAVCYDPTQPFPSDQFITLGGCP